MATRRISPVSRIKKAQRESEIYRHVSGLVMRAAADDLKIRDLTITRVELTDNKGLCFVYFHTPLGAEHFKKDTLNALIPYKPSMRKALSQLVSGRTVPDLLFRYDTTLDKVMRIERIIEEVSSKSPADHDDDDIE